LTRVIFLETERESRGERGKFEEGEKKGSEEICHMQRWDLLCRIHVIDVTWEYRHSKRRGVDRRGEVRGER
jgi:hypothetical protein